MFRGLRVARRKALIAFVTAGYPSPAATPRLVRALESAGADLVELGVPFSDPLADGATIQHTSHQALAKGMTLHRVLDAVRTARRQGVRLPLVLMTYLNPVESFGRATFARAAAAAGVDGVIVPDLPAEEAAPLLRALRSAGLALIMLVAPTSGSRRARAAARLSDGFVYLVSVTGVTGARRRLSSDVAAFARSVRRVTSKPLAVGFGLARPEQIRALRASADGFIVGSAILERIRANPGHWEKPLRRFVGAMHHACR